MLRNERSPVLRIKPGETPEAFAEAGALFREYSASLGVDLSFQNFEEELASLPGDYAPPDGRLLLAYWDESKACATEPAQEVAGEGEFLFRRAEALRFHHEGETAALLRAAYGRGSESASLQKSATQGVARSETLIATSPRHEGEVVCVAGCVALRKFDGGICEMKRLYVRPEFRGHRIGKSLVEAVIAAAGEIGYRAIRLDTLPQMAEAQALYEALAFHEIEAYRYNPVAGARYFEKDL